MTRGLKPEIDAPDPFRVAIVGPLPNHGAIHFQVAELVRYIIIGLLAVALGQTSVLAEEPGGEAYVPARFAAGLDEASMQIGFPKHKRDVSFYINCAARLSSTGELQSYFCLDYRGGSDTKFRKSIDEFMEVVEFTPAMVDGAAVPVEIYFRVFFGRRGDQYAAGVFPNWGDDADAYGLDYEAPQRYNSREHIGSCDPTAGITRVRIKPDGKPTGDVDLMMSYGEVKSYSLCENHYVDGVTNGSYIPALHQGKPVEATYVELNGDPSWFSIRKPEGL